MFKPYSLNVTRFINQNTVVRHFDTLEELVLFRDSVISKLKCDSRSHGETFEIVSKLHKDAAFDYEILESQDITVSTKV